MSKLRRYVTLPTACAIITVAFLLSAAAEAFAATPPAPSITSTPDQTTRSTSAVFMWERNAAGGMFECSLDGSVFSPCSAPRFYSVNEGQHTFAVRQVSADIEVGPEASYTWTVDRTAPSPPSSLSGPGSPTNARTATVTFTTSEPGGAVECALDDTQTFAPCSTTTSHTMSGLTDGQRILWLRHRDAAGNTSGISFYRWTVDTAAPAAPTFARHPDPQTYEEVASFLVQARDPYDTDGEECSLDGDDFVDCESQVVAVSVGTHTLQARTKDEAGNRSAVASFTWERLERPVVVPEPEPTPTPDPSPQPEPPVIVPPIVDVPRLVPPFEPAHVCQPVISSVEPGAVMAGQAFAVTGSGFGATPGVISVASRAALLQAWSNTQVIAVVAPGTPAGKTTVRVACAGGGDAVNAFEVLKPANLPPVAVGVALPVSAGKYKLDASNSYDPDGKICSYRWSYKGKTISKKAVVTRSGLRAGTKYLFALSVRDCAGSSGATKVTVTPKKKKAPVKLNISGQALFAFDACTLSQSGAAKVRSYSKYLKGAKRVTISGHTDAIGSDAYNLTLSQCRAQSVKGQLVGKRKVKTVTVKGYGESKPVAKNTTATGADNPAGRAKNRRVEIAISY